jgi:hypothetical protein
MASRKRFLAIPLALGAFVLAAALATSASATASTASEAHPASVQATKPSALERALLHSHELWATIDVCDPADQPSTVGIRGSMPGDGHKHDSMYMSFRLQYMNASGRWVNLSSDASSSFAPVGTGASARQGGTSFELQPVAGRPAVTLRGVVDFQWRRGKTVIVSGAEPTTAAHKSLAGADPEGYSAASCIIG